MSSLSNFHLQQQQQRPEQNNPFIVTIDSGDSMERSQMDELRSSIPNGYVAIRRGNFAKVKENFHNREIVKLWVKERNLKDGFIRKYRKRNGKKWECCGCVSNKNSRRRSNGNVVHDFQYARIKVAEYNEDANTLYVAKAHSPNSCKPYSITLKEFQDHLPLYERKPKVRKLNATAATTTSAPIVLQMPLLSSTTPDAAASSSSSFLTSTHSLSSTHDRLLSAFTNILKSPIPCSSRTVLYSTNPTTNPMRSDTATIHPHRGESLNATAAQQPQPTPAPVITSPSVTATVTPSTGSTTATVAQPPTTPTNLVVGRSVDDPNIITEGAGNYEEQENVQNNLREKSIVSIPDDPATETIPVKNEAYAYMEPNEMNPTNVSIGVNGVNNVDEEMVEVKEDIVSFEPAANKTLQPACKKLNLTSYCRGDALGVWAKVDVVVVRSRSNSIISGRKGNGFECLALLLTGAFQNQYELMARMKDKLDGDEEMKARYDVTQRLEMSTKFCDEHLVLLAHWLSCRIGVYEHGVLQKYGNWNSLTQSNDLIILMEKEGDLYAPILNL